MSTPVTAPTSSIEADTERHQPTLELLSVPSGLRPERPSTPGRYLELEGEEAFIPLEREIVHIGRGLLVDVRLDDHLVSRRHAILVRRAGGHRLLDDRSANGTLVNGRRVEQVQLSDGDVIVLGRSMLRYVVVS